MPNLDSFADKAAGIAIYPIRHFAISSWLTTSMSWRRSLNPHKMAKPFFLTFRRII